MNWLRQRKLFDFCRSGDIRGVIGFLEQRPSRINTTNIWNQTALYLACENGRTAVAQYLLDNGADVCRGRTNPLIAAVRYGHYDCVKLLLEYHADPNCHSLRRETPISIALRKHPGNIKLLILLLLQYDAIPSTLLSEEISVQLLKNAEVEHTKAIQKLIDGNFINLTAESTLLAAFDFAFKRGSVELAEKILSNYSRIEQLYAEAVYYSAKNNWPNILSKLIEKRVDVNTLIEGQTPLYAACKEGHEYAVSLLLDNGADPDVPNDFGTIELHLEIDGYDDKLSSAAANINALDRDGATPLHLACKRGETRIVKLLLSHGADPDIATVGPNTWYPIHPACYGLHYDVVKLLLEYHADVNVRDSTGKTALHCALSVSNGDGDKSGDLIQLLLDAGADVNAAYKLGETPFNIACFKGMESVAKKMLKYGAKVDMSVVQLLLTNGANQNLHEDGSDSRCSSFPLHMAAAGDNGKLVEFLLEHGADIDVADINGNTALHHAIEYYSNNSRNAMSVVDILLENKANVNIVNNSGDTPLYRAVSNGLLDVVSKMLEKCGGNPNGGSPTKCPLVEACLMSNRKLVGVLLKHGADPNLTWTSCDPRSEREIPLFHAVDKGSVNITRKLLKAGSDVHAVNGEGKSVVSFATENMLNSRHFRSTEHTRNRLSIVRLLLQRGADVNTIMPHASSPLYPAVTALAEADAQIWEYLYNYSQYRIAVIKLLQLIVKYGAKLQDSCCQTGDNVRLLVTLATLDTFDLTYDFILKLFRAGAEFQLLARCCKAVETHYCTTKSISLCQAAVLAGYVPSDEELQKLKSAAARGRTAQIQQLVNWLNEDRRQVPSLQRQCRVVIRRQLSVAARFQSILPTIEQLHLPNVIKEYLRFDGPLTEVDLRVNDLRETDETFSNWLFYMYLY